MNKPNNTLIAGPDAAAFAGSTLRVHEYEHGLYGTRLDIRLPKGAASPIVADLGPNEFSPCLAVQREFGRLLVERFNEAPSLRAKLAASEASRKELVGALETAEQKLLNYNGAPIVGGNYFVATHAIELARAALANALKPF